MEYRTLENIDSICIYEAFTQAFSDYQVSVDMSFKSSCRFYLEWSERVG